MSDLDRASEDPRVAKRRRTELLLDPYNIVTYSDFWFPDGDIVLEVEHYRFKIHCHRIAKCSDIFSDMLQVPQPVQVDSVDGCPLVHLSDASEDWALVLRWMYDPMSFIKLPHPVPFSLIPGSLRIATKYEIHDLRKWAVRQLCARWPSEIERMDTTALSSAAEAISIARECDVPEILPAAFYALALQRWRFNADGGRAHLVLAPADMRRLLVGRERLQAVYTQILLDPLVGGPVGAGESPSRLPYAACAACRESLVGYWRRLVAAQPQAPMDCWLLRDLLRLFKEKDVLLAQQVCPACWNWHSNTVWERFINLKRAIPGYFR